MTTSIPAIYEDGVFKPMEGVNLPNHKKIEIVILPFSADYSKLLKKQKHAIREIVGFGRSNISDISAKHDKYLYQKER